MKTKNIFKFCITSFLGLMIFLCFVPSVRAEDRTLGEDYIEYQNNYVYRRLYNPKTGSHIYESILRIQLNILSQNGNIYYK